eukprot:21226_1
MIGISAQAHDVSIPSCLSQIQPTNQLVNPSDRIKSKQVDEEILNLLLDPNPELDTVYALMKDDMKNCFNRIKRAPTLRNISEICPSLYHTYYANFSQPTQIKFNNGIVNMFDGLGQGNVLSGLGLLLNNYVINEKSKQLYEELGIVFSMINDMAYFDDSNRIGTLRSLILVHLIKLKLGLFFGYEYNTDKSELILSYGIYRILRLRDWKCMNSKYLSIPITKSSASQEVQGIAKNSSMNTMWNLSEAISFISTIK